MAIKINSSISIFVLTILMILLIQNYPFVAANRALIATTCKNTKYPDVCISALESDPRSFTANLIGLGRIAMEITADKVAKGVTVLYNGFQPPTDYGTWSAYVACYESYKSALAEIKKFGLTSFDKGKYRIAARSIHSANVAATDCSIYPEIKEADMNNFVLQISADTEAILDQLH